MWPPTRRKLIQDVLSRVSHRHRVANRPALPLQRWASRRMHPRIIRMCIETASVSLDQPQCGNLTDDARLWHPSAQEFGRRQLASGYRSDRRPTGDRPTTDRRKHARTLAGPMAQWPRMRLHPRSGRSVSRAASSRVTGRHSFGFESADQGWQRCHDRFVCGSTGQILVSR